MHAPTLEDLAPEGLDLAADPYPVYATLRARGPVHRVRLPEGGTAWLVVTRDLARAALTDPRLRNDDRYASGPGDGTHSIGRNMLQSDPPQHTRLRRLVAGHFTPGRIAALRPGIEAVATELLAELPRHGTADLVSSYALPLPVAVICDLLGVPQADRTVFHTWSNELVLPTSPEAAASAAAELTGYLTELTNRKRENPDGTLLSDLVAVTRAPGADATAEQHAGDGAGREAGNENGNGDGIEAGNGDGDEAGDLSYEELLGMAFLILVAGHETTVNLISGTLHSLLTHPEQLDLLRADPELTPGAVEESLRYNSPVHSALVRYAAEPLELADTPIAAGDAVLVSLAAASRDPLHFPDPDRFDIRRRAQGHLGFGHGLHHCLGAPLARVEADIALRRLLADRPALALATDPDALTWRTSTLLRGLVELPLRLG